MLSGRSEDESGTIGWSCRSIGRKVARSWGLEVLNKICFRLVSRSQSRLVFLLIARCGGTASVESAYKRDSFFDYWKIESWLSSLFYRSLARRLVFCAINILDWKEKSIVLGSICQAECCPFCGFETWTGLVLCLIVWSKVIQDSYFVGLVIRKVLKYSIAKTIQSVSFNLLVSVWDNVCSSINCSVGYLIALIVLSVLSVRNSGTELVCERDLFFDQLLGWKIE